KIIIINEVADTDNNLSEHSLPANFFCLDNNYLVALPKEIGELTRLQELHIQGNRLTVLPPEMENLDLVGTKQIFKADGNPWVAPIADQFQVGISHVFDYIRSDTYKFLYCRYIAASAAPPPKTKDKTMTSL
ncbi:unnamed protein product, partial [Candidula unifasciata]